MRQTAYPQDPAAGLAEEFLQHRGRFRWLPTSPPSSPPREGGQPRRLFSSSSRARESAIHADYSGEDWFSAVILRPPPNVLRLRCRRPGCGSMRTPRRHATKYRSGTPRRSIYRHLRLPAPDSAPPDPIPHDHPREFADINRIPLASHSLGTLSERLSSCGWLEAINPHEDRKVNERPVIMFDLTR